MQKSNALGASLSRVAVFVCGQIRILVFQVKCNECIVGVKKCVEISRILLNLLEIW